MTGTEVEPRMTSDALSDDGSGAGMKIGAAVRWMALIWLRVLWLSRTIREHLTVIGPHQTAPDRRRRHVVSQGTAFGPPRTMTFGGPPERVRSGRWSPPEIRPRCRPLDERSTTCSERAWQAAESGGALPVVPDAERPAIEVTRPADPAHGDLATNLALKLARPMRRSPLAIAEALAAALRTESTVTTGGVPLLSEVTAAAPGFVNMRLAAGMAGGCSRRGAWRPARRSAASSQAQPTAHQRGVRLGQPDRPAPHRQRARRVRGRPPLPRARGGRPPGHARVLLQRLRGPGPPPWRVGRWRSGRAARCPRTATAATTSASWPSELPGDVLAAAAAAAPMRTTSSGGGPRSGSGRASRRRSPASACTSTSGRARAPCTATAGSRGPSSGCRPPASCTSRTAPCGSARPSTATTRTASCGGRTASSPTSAPTSATSWRSVSAASTRCSTSGARITTGRWPGCATRRRRWACRRGRCGCCSSPGCASCATAARSPCPSGPASSSPSTSC